MEQELITNLVSVIKREEGLLRDFLDLLESQKQLLVQNKVEEFDQSVLQQEELIQEIKTLEGERIKLVNQIARGMQVEENELTLTRLVEMSLGQVSSELQTAKRSMSQLVERIKRANQVNQYLIKRSLNVSQRSIDLLIDENLRDVVYEQTGKLSGQDRRSMIVNKTL
ncbi:flagellar protein FlgN [bacterium]|nr:flagellar protein FlgN [bacterium]